ncbi:hypothetical protein GCM10020220_017030 [Nonomuraea rubra]|uniref:hypothetical protein n=1 Tax=Nonomuraea rubra TaxID=46180 RepID=UPI0031E73EDC
MINVVEWTRLEPWRVARARTDRDETVIVKWSGPHAARTHSEEWRLRTEVAALRFLAEDLGVRLAPRVLAEDLAGGAGGAGGPRAADRAGRAVAPRWGSGARGAAGGVRPGPG